MTRRRRLPPLSWTAERDGFRHAFRNRRGLTLCEIVVDERRSRPDQPKCAACVSLEVAEAGACRR
jgi:hypothetical protein